MFENGQKNIPVQVGHCPGSYSTALLVDTHPIKEKNNSQYILEQRLYIELEGLFLLQYSVVQCSVLIFVPSNFYISICIY